MRIGGHSVCGSYHDKDQDCFIAERTEKGWLIAVSDGVGSCEFSEIGSRAACRSIRELITEYGGIPQDTEGFFAELHERWLSNITSLPEKHDVSDCYATLLFCYLEGNRAFAARLGDGYIALRAGDSCLVLFDDKSDHLLNETDSLYEEHTPSAWEVVDVELDQLTIAIVCTDGLTVYPYEQATINQLLDDLVAEYSSASQQDIINDIIRWLPEWMSNDDKTIAFMMGD